MNKPTTAQPHRFEEGQMVWISRWALSEGIKSGTFLGKTWPHVDWFFDLIVDGESRHASFFPRQFHATEEEARAAANAQRDKRIKSLRTQLAKLEQMKF